MADYLDRLDANECFSLALECSNRNQHGEAIAYLKRALELEPTNAKACYFLGAEYAQVGMMDRAGEAMDHALQLDPSLHTARFQLGLLHLTSARVEQAIEVWRGLDVLGEEHPLYLFKMGLEALARDEFSLCNDLLLKGISLNAENEALNGDMRKVLNALPKNDDGNAADDDSTAEEEADESGENVFLTAYRKSTQH